MLGHAGVGYTPGREEMAEPTADRGEERAVDGEEKSEETWRESPLFGLIRLLGRLLLALLLAYWVIFILYSIGKMVLGGPHAVVAWYAHLEAEGSAVFLPHWNPVAFLLRQLLIVGITAGLWLGVGPRRRGERLSRRI